MSKPVAFTREDGEKESLYILEETKLGGISYLLAADQPEGSREANAVLLKEVSGADGEESVYAEVTNEQEIEALSHIFSELVEDIVFV